jgi:hypothetical protein
MFSRMKERELSEFFCHSSGVCRVQPSHMMVPVPLYAR